MKTHKKTVSKTTKMLFPIVITILGGLIAPMGLPLLATIMLGNLMKESGVVSRLTKAAENEISNIVTLLLGISIGATMNGPLFVQPQTLLILALGLLAICLDTVFGVLFGKVLYIVTGGKVNPLIGAAGISAFPMSARVVQKEGQKYNKTELSPHACHGRQCRRSDRLCYGSGCYVVRVERHGRNLNLES